ncbi:CDP-glycerol glycerophosphotransferase family protein [Enterococcus thailandicus]|uniref:CDP-glycerol glycerophosphotransferase family protein n=1 Tax=Enterococcus thailandicus TaxID=417368 RepID=UPI002890FB64|nr:CDP-glycerol glycerophosphotransferase family protein [Enterococcus thailandicus]MDT2751720.1 CDP-glycerol glycerophosphotransferase family protein [Enterococcus thailandicus]MDT2775861.1 CDP-glycerol glycerophosphotransferase family protein [Enterococcus thailandicus]
MVEVRQKMEHIYHKFVCVSFKILGKLPKKKQIIFESFHGKQYSDNPRAIYEYVRENHPEYTCIWAVKKGFETPFIENKVPYVRRMGLKWLIAMGISKYWIFNTRMPAWMFKSSQTKYIQTWHGTPLKRLGLDIKNVTMPGTDTNKYRENFKNEAARWDYLISPNAYSTEIFRSAFAYEGEILEIGYPRNDILLLPDNSEKIKQIRKKLTIAENQKVILYAPTWRDNQFIKKGAYKFDNQFPFAEILEQEKDTIILTRLHYLVAEQFDPKQYGNRVIDVSSYEDISHLYLIADLLITDYSSVMFDFALTKKPLIFYMYDFDSYGQEIRGFYDGVLDNLPGPIVKDKKELVSEINSINLEGFIDKAYQNFIKKYCLILDETSSKKIFEYLEIE